MTQSALAFSADFSHPTFNFGDHLVRIFVRDGEPWFVAKDVMFALGYSGHSAPAKVCEHIPEEWKGVNPIHTPGGEQKMLCLSEHGLYFFLGRSDKAAALPFQKWVYGEVIPSIRKTGGYAKPTADAERVNKALSLVAEVMPQVSRAIFDAVMTGQNWQADRYMLSFDVNTRGLVPQAKKIDSNAYVMPMDRFYDAIETSMSVDPAVLARLAATCTNRLGSMAHEARTTPYDARLNS